MPWLMNLRDTLPGAAMISEAVAGLSARRSLPKWRSDYFRASRKNTESIAIATAVQVSPGPRKVLGASISPQAAEDRKEVALFVDTFNRYFEPENIEAAGAVFKAAGYRVHLPLPLGSRRPLCCGRTFLSVGQVDQARREAEHTVAVLQSYLDAGIPIVGLEPSCILGFRDEIPAILKNDAARQLAENAFMFEEFLVREASAGRLKLPLKKIADRALVHGHCHQKAFDAFGAVEQVLKLIPGLSVEPIESSCCGMAGAFGFGADTVDVSFAMGELSLLPEVRKADADTIIIADGTSCRHQIRDGAGREAVHVARVLAKSLQ
jgi:Fe-S oxidoreductase